MNSIYHSKTIYSLFREIKLCKIFSQMIICHMIGIMIAIYKMLLTAIWNILCKGEPYSAQSCLSDNSTGQTQARVLTTQQALNLLMSRGVIIKDNTSPNTE